MATKLMRRVLQGIKAGEYKKAVGAFRKELKDGYCYCLLGAAMNEWHAMQPCKEDYVWLRFPYSEALAHVATDRMVSIAQLSKQLGFSSVVRPTAVNDKYHDWEPTLVELHVRCPLAITLEDLKQLMTEEEIEKYKKELTWAT